MNTALAAVLLIGSAISFYGGGTILVGAKSALHEIEAFLLFLISTVFFVGFAITLAIGEFTRFVKREANRPR